MKVQIVDPAAYTPPYDHALCGALARAGVDVELITCRFPYGPVPREDGYEMNELFYRLASREDLNPRARRALRAVEHLPGMVRAARHARRADLVHYQWLPVPKVDRHLLARGRPRVFTMHWRLPRADSGMGRALAAQLERMDAIVIHSEHGARRLADDFGVDPERIEVIPHGAFDYLTRQPEEEPLPEELSEVTKPVILAFGLIRPYKGTKELLHAFKRLNGRAELWIVGMPRMPMGPLREIARTAPGTVRFVDRFVTDPEIPAFMRRADLVALPYRNIEQSGVLYTALAFGRPMVLSDVGGFPEIAAQGAAVTVPREDPEALANAIARLLDDPAERERMAAAALAAAQGPYSWDRIGRDTASLYERLLR